MKKILKNTALALVGVIFAWSIWFLPKAHAAGTATLYLSPASGSYNKGSTLTVNVYENSGTDSVNAVQANLSYPAGLLTFSSITSSSAFGIDAESTGGGGSVRIGRGTITPVTGAQLVATVRFTVAAAGTANINFASGSAVVRSTDNGSETLTTTGGSYTLKTPPPTPTDTSTPPPASTPPKTSPPPTTQKPATSTPKPPAAKPGSTLTITDITVTNLTATSATINWHTSIAATSIVKYGQNTSYANGEVDTKLATSHSLALDPANLKPATTFHFVVKAVDAKGETAASQDMTFTTKPAPVAAPTTKKTGSLVPVIAVGVVAALAAAAAGLYLGSERLRNSVNRLLHLGRGPATPTPTTPPISSGGSMQAPAVVKPTDKLPPTPPAPPKSQP